MSVSLSVPLLICPSVNISVCQYVHPSIRLSVHLSNCPSVHLYVCLFIRPSVRLSVYLSVYPSAHLPSICLSICLAVCLSVHLNWLVNPLPPTPYLLIFSSLHSWYKFLIYFISFRCFCLSIFIPDLSSTFLNLLLCSRNKNKI